MGLRKRLALWLAPELRELLTEAIEWVERPVADQDDAVHAIVFVERVRKFLTP